MGKHGLNSSIMLDFNDILIKPKVITNIISRSDINPFYDDYKLPLITAPMDTVVNDENAHLFSAVGLNVCLPRGEKSEDRGFFKSYSLNEFKLHFLDNSAMVNEMMQSINRKVLIDTANGHIQEMLDAVKKAKDLYGDRLTLMVGNIANSKTYVQLSEAGADYIRVGIGNGGGCLTTQQTGVGFPMASLINLCYFESLELNKPAKIVADGGMQTYSDIIKALALGADYVMVGSLLNKCLESSGSNYLFKYIPISSEFAERAYKFGFKINKKFRGMSTKEVQKEWGNTELKTSEGVVRYREVEYTLNGWVDNFKSYLRSAMSYSGARTLNEFIGEAEIVKISDNAYRRFNK